MGTAVAATNTELAINRIGEILGPGGAFEVEKIRLRQQYGPIVAAAQKITAITNADEAQEAANAGRMLRAGVKDYTEAFKAVKTRIDDVKKPVLAEEKEVIAPLEKEGTRLAGLVQVFQQEVERKRQEEERKAREAAEAQAREDALLRAIEAEEAGSAEEAQAILEEPIIAGPVVLASPAPTKPTGSVTRTTYSAEVTDFKALVKAVAEGRVPLMALQANEQFLNQQAKSFGAGFSMPGVKLVENTSTHFRS